MISNTSVLGSKTKNVSGVAAGCTITFYTDMKVSFHRLSSDKFPMSILMSD